MGFIQSFSQVVRAINFYLVLLSGFTASTVCVRYRCARRTAPPAVPCSSSTCQRNPPPSSAITVGYVDSPCADTCWETHCDVCGRQALMVVQPQNPSSAAAASGDISLLIRLQNSSLCCVLCSLLIATCRTCSLRAAIWTDCFGYCSSTGQENQEKAGGSTSSAHSLQRVHEG